MLQRFDLRPLARHHFRSLVDPGQRRMTASTWAVVFGLPLALGLAAALAVPVQGNGVLPAALSMVPAAAGTLTAGFLAAFVLLMNLRIKLQETTALPRTPDSLRSVSTAAMSSLYLATVSGAALALALSLAVFAAPLAALHIAFLKAAIGVVVALLAHTLVNAITVLRRAAGAYFVMFRGEVDRPHLAGVDKRDRKAS